MIIAPFRVFQNIDTDKNVNAFFRSVLSHLLSHGSCILNVFRPNASAIELFETLENEDEIFSWEKPLDNGVLRHSYKRKKIKRDPFVLYPELIYRYFETKKLIKEVSFVIPMCVYYPDEFKRLIQRQVYRIRGVKVSLFRIISLQGIILCGAFFPPDRSNGDSN